MEIISGGLKNGVGGVMRLRESLINVVSVKQINTDESQELHYPDSKEKRTIVEINLDLPWGFQTSKNSKLKRFEKKGSLHHKVQSTEMKDAGDGMLTQDKSMDNFIKAVMKNDTAKIKTMMRQNGKEIVVNKLLKFKQKVNLKDDDKQQAISVCDLEIFLDVLQFVVMQEKPDVLDVILKNKTFFGIGSNNQLSDLLQTSLIRLNSIDRRDISQFEYEDIKLEKQSILHLAANGNIQCLKILLSHLRFTSSDISTSEDCHKRTPMHIAASNSSMECLDTLYVFVKDKRAILLKDNMGYTPLHYAVKFGKLETVIFILSKLPNVEKDISGGDGINAMNRKGKTPLFYAKDPHFLYLLLHYGADPSIISYEQESVLEAYIRTNPENARALMNYDVDTNDRETTDKDYVYTYKFRLFLNKVGQNKMGSNEDLDTNEEMVVMAKFSDLHQRKLLNAPAAELYLHMKWSMSSKFFYLNLFLYLAFILSLTTFVYWTSYEKNHQEDLSNKSCYSGWYTNGHYEHYGIKPWAVLHIWTFLFTLAILMREFLQLIAKRAKYFKSRENCLELFVLLVSFAYLILVSFTGDSICELEQALGAVALFFAWIEMTLLIGRFPSVGIYIFMSVNVFKQLVKLFSFYSTTLFAFACAYSIILPQSPIFENLFTSSIKVIVMMIGEFDFESNFIMDSDTQSGDWPSKIITQFIFIALMFMVALTLANLIIGLTVQNIAELQREAGTYKLNKTVEQIRETENILLKNKCFAGFLTKFPKMEKYTELVQKIQMYTKQSLAPNDIEVCIKPDKDRVIHDSRSLTYSHFDVYIYNADNRKKGKKINMEIPEWIVKNTEKALEERKKIFDELDTQFDSFRKAQRNSMNFSRFSYSSEAPSGNRDSLPLDSLALDETDRASNESDMLQDARDLLKQMEKYFNKTNITEL